MAQAVSKVMGRTARTAGWQAVEAAKRVAGAKLADKIPQETVEDMFNLPTMNPLQQKQQQQQQQQQQEKDSMLKPMLDFGTEQQVERVLSNNRMAQETVDELLRKQQNKMMLHPWGVALGPDVAVNGEMAGSVPQLITYEMAELSKRKQHSVTLKYMMDFGAKPSEKQLLLSAQFLHKELPVRLARSVAGLEGLPYGLSSNSQVLMVRNWYVESFKDLRCFPEVKDVADENRFTDMLRNIYERHANVVPALAKGVASLKHELSREIQWNELPEIQQFLDRFYLSRIGIRMLIGQHIELHKPLQANHIGLICTKCSPWQVAQDAISNARKICLSLYGSAPKVEVYGDPNFTFAYVPSHMNQMIFELVKNSLRAVQDRFEKSKEEPPAVRLIIAEGNEDVTIKVSDEGGGIPRSGFTKLWTYLYSTAESSLSSLDEEASNSPAVVSGYGYGLPFSRLHARYFGGDLQIVSMDGYGTDAYLHLSRLGNYEEPLP